MIPLTLLSGRPATGCTCASGEYKLVCVAHLFRGKARHDFNATGVACGKACCRQQGGDIQSVACCQTGDCPLSGGPDNSGGKTCCNPDMQTAVAVAPAVAFSVDNNHHMLFDLPVVEKGNVFGEPAVARDIPNEAGPPGGDLVISLRRLLV